MIVMNSPLSQEADDLIIEVPYSSNAWLFRITMGLMLIGPLVNLFGVFSAILILAVIFLGSLFSPVSTRIAIRERTVTYVYSRLLPFKKKQVISLAPFSRIYSEPYGYGGRKLQMSGPKGEHIVLARFHQSIGQPEKHIEKVAEIRKRLAAAWGVADAGGR